MEILDENYKPRAFFWTPFIFLRLEGVIWFFLGLFLFHYFQGSWWLFIATFFVPDVSLIGYLFGPRKGALFYNLMHAEVGPLLLAGFSFLFGMPILLNLALIWFCHVNFDRMLGFGLKFSDGFIHTHLGIISFKRSVK